MGHSAKPLFEVEDWRNLPPEDLLDATDPTNDPYFRSLGNLQAVAMTQADDMRPRHVAVVRAHHRGDDNKTIAKAVRLTPNTVSTILARPDAKKLLNTLRHIEHVRSGPQLDQRKNILYRIAARTERTDPSVAISAIRELNKIDGSYTPVEPPAPPTVQITINQENFPKTALDAPAPSSDGVLLEHAPDDSDA